MRNLRREFLDVGKVDIHYGKTSCAPALGAVLCLFALMAGTARAVAVTAIYRRRRSFDRNRLCGTPNCDMKNIPLMRAPHRFLPEPRLQSNAVGFPLIEPARQ